LAAQLEVKSRKEYKDELVYVAISLNGKRIIRSKSPGIQRKHTPFAFGFFPRATFNTKTAYNKENSKDKECV
jgi:hypothetical protein